MRTDGACPDCLGHGLCDYHKVETHKRERAQAEQIRLAVIVHREQNTLRLMARLELESDEGGTAYDKAARLLAD